MTLRAVPLLPEAVCLKPESSLLDALRLLLEKGVNHLPVCNGDSWAGLLDINDILGELLPVSARGEHGLKNLRFVGDGTALISSHVSKLKDISVRQVQLHDLPTLDEDTPLLEAALLLHRHGKPLPVLGKDGKFKGMLSRRVLLAHLINKMGG
jgi:CBS domain-containing protein